MCERLLQTKHFQTLFWTHDIRLVDCPGLVMPSYIPMELQVLCGILPIAQTPSIASCVQHAGQLIPLEHILGLTHPRLKQPQEEDKRTWRGGVRPRRAEDETAPTWTAMDIMTSYAEDKGWLTAKAGRPDSNRAGNFSKAAKNMRYFHD